MRRRRMLAEINVVPYIDVMLVLLVIFMVTAPMLMQGVEVDLPDADAILEGSRRAMRVALMRETDRIEQHLPFLASVGSTSPYIGLLGTVWGIMHSFRGLANATQATLATVAPGISEALIATAMGLFAAIPAVLAYNRLAARSDALLNRYETFLDEFSGILQRRTYALKANQSQRP